MRCLSILFYLLTIGFTHAQVNEGLSPEERAYLFHIVKKSPILDNSIGRYFDYKGPDIRFPNKELNYDSVELIIINNPEKLIIRNEEISKCSKGILSEAANKVALWELNKVLLAKRGSDKEVEPYIDKLNVFESMLLPLLPENAVKEKDGKIIANPKLYSVINPGLSFDDKLALLESFRFMEQYDCLITMRALNETVNSYVEKRSFEIFQALGGIADEYSNILIAAGDGSNTTGLLEEREKDERGRWNKGLPKAVGLFPYQLTIQTDDKTKQSSIEPLRYAIMDQKTVGNGKETAIHFDVWGYNSSRQTTVVIEKNGMNYPLFGSKDTRFLSPDSTFSDGATFKSVINDLERNKIGHIKELLYGKRGFDNSIAYNKKKKDEVELRIEKAEKEYSDLHGTPIMTSGKAPKEVRKAKKQARKNNHAGGPVDYKPTTYSNKSKKKKKQNEIVYLYDLFKQYERKIAELEKQRAEALDILFSYEARLDRYKQLMGRKWASYKEEDGLYIFEDSSRFDLYTQDFYFPATADKKDFEIRLIAIPEGPLTDQVDEVMMHVNIADAKPNYHSRIQIELMDVFASDSYKLDKKLLSDKDSVAIIQFFEALMDKDMNFSIHANGQGVGHMVGCCVQKDPQPKELDSYPPSLLSTGNAQMDSAFISLRKSELFVTIDREIILQVNSFTDPVRSNLKATSEDLTSFAASNKLSKNDLLSAYRTAEILNRFKAEINVLAGTYLPREKAKLVIDKFNKEYAKIKIEVGNTSIRLADFSR